MKTDSPPQSLFTFLLLLLWEDSSLTGACLLTNRQVGAIIELVDYIQESNPGEGVENSVKMSYTKTVVVIWIQRINLPTTREMF
jgi:hypothetical protein